MPKHLMIENLASPVKSRDPINPNALLRSTPVNRRQRRAKAAAQKAFDKRNNT